MEEKRTFWERAWARIFGGGSRRPARIERVVQYVAHRLDQGARLEEAIQDEYGAARPRRTRSGRSSPTPGSSRPREDGCTGNSAQSSCPRRGVRDGIRSNARFETRAASGEIELEVRAPGKLRARGDAARTGQILGILLDNAFRHTPPRGRIDVTASTLDRRVEVGGADTGTGVAPEHLPRIFDRFYRADSSRSRNGGATGLGLSIAHDLARAQGGDLTAENAKSGGAVFRLRLPGHGD